MRLVDHIHTYIIYTLMCINISYTLLQPHVRFSEEISFLNLLPI